MAIGSGGLSSGGKSGDFPLPSIEVMEFLGTPDRVKDRVAELRKAKQEAEDAARKLIGAKNIDKALQESEENRRKAKEVLESATSEAAEKIKTAKADAEAIYAELRQERAEFASWKQTEESNLAKREADLDHRESTVKAREYDVAKSEEDVKTLQKEAGEVKVKFTNLMNETKKLWQS